MIHCENLSIQNRLSVKEFSFESGHCGVIGPNGAGKSSFLKAVANLVDFQGKCFVEGDVAYCGDCSSIQSDMAAQEVLNYARGSKAQDLDYLKKLVSHFNFECLLSRKVSTLSGGEKQRLNLISAFYYDCELTLLDEPTNFLDPIYVESLSHFLQDYKKSCFVVSHDFNFIINICSRLVAFENLKLSFDSTIDEAFEYKVFDKIFHKKFNYHVMDNKRYIL
ncbi:ABC transporter, ATP-binding protein [Bacteriovorax sp. BAL6_X]|uniref:ATP-binding cassette domain-containing protein n=1 Tax=Bacteriovorax sp. BAL6_X TaxID=1201290 RepID=UPI00038611F3|nr:ATP-binding cassette domain-containing protein [Bacteriovorax sp. BAL6_X]EPZ49334.1 ABC transporter, ATP-binding protein [Bacteriovorax sp. BAL6_X]